jgi:hypothetical protein
VHGYGKLQVDLSRQQSHGAAAVHADARVLGREEGAGACVSAPRPDSPPALAPLESPLHAMLTGAGVGASMVLNCGGCWRCEVLSG